MEEAADDNQNCRVLQCAYHGWEFNAEGSCVRIPQLGTADNKAANFFNNPRACVTSFPVQVAQDLLWIYPSNDSSKSTSSKPPAVIEQLDEPNMLDATQLYVRDLPYSYDILVENLCDPSHISWAHHSYMNGADRYQPSDDAYQLDFTVGELAVNGTNAQGQAFVANKDNPPIPKEEGEYKVVFQPPCL